MLNQTSCLDYAEQRHVVCDSLHSSTAVYVDSGYAIFNFKPSRMVVELILHPALD